MQSEATFSKIEEEILKFWEENQAFEVSKQISQDWPEYVFYDGPPFATGLPHYGHILSGTIKDTIARFFFQKGFRMEKKFGWDCHGLPVEYEIDKKLNITTRQEVFEMGIANYNKACKDIVLKYTDDWEVIVNRMGRWIDFKNGFKTMDINFMESVWHIFKMLYERGSVYLGHRVMPFSTACSTPVSNFEANQNYKDISDPSILIYFPLLHQKLNLIVWTTTPWTLPSNLALLINKNFTYVIFTLEDKAEFFVMVKERVPFYFKTFTVIREIAGEKFLNEEYLECFNYFSHFRGKGFFRIFHADFVAKDEGSGIVHCAPAFGEEDYNACVSLNLIKENEDLPCEIDDKGKFTSKIIEYQGLYFKDADKLIIKDLKDKILFNSRITHRYPFCWRSDTPLIYKLVPNWFVRVKNEIPKLLQNNLLINWVPENIKYKKFHNWLSNAKDWSISRNRFWGAPIPLWQCKNKFICIGSIEELEEKCNTKITDLHREFIDHLTFKIGDDEYKRIDEVFDCWFESGSMPYAQKNYPKNEINHPADFIAEGLDQTRGWFYTLHVISSILFDSPAFKNVIVNGIVLAEDGKKMSKRLKNYPDVNLIFSKYGADSLRMYLISSPVVLAENLNFSEKGVFEVVKNLLIPFYNSFLFFKECELENTKLEMDDWILNSFNTFCYSIYKDVENYKLSKVYENALLFLDDLSNWYIRMNRRLIRENGHLLGILLKNFSIVMAPFIPFFSEFIYQEIKKIFSPNSQFFSVHFEKHLKFTEIKDHPFNLVKEVIEAIRKLRESKNISLKTPLNLCTVICTKEMEDALLEYSPVIKEECFLLSLIFKRESEYSFKTEIKPDFNELKKSEKMKEKIQLIRQFNEEDISNLLKNLSITKNKIQISTNELLINKEIIFKNLDDQFIFSNFKNFSLILDIKMTDILLEIKCAREFFSFYQKMRKLVKLSPTDNVFVFLDNNELKQKVSKYYEMMFTNKPADNYLCVEKYVYDGKQVCVMLFESMG